VYFFYSTYEAAEIAKIPIYTGPALVEDEVPVARLRVIAPPRFLEKCTRRATELCHRVKSHPDGAMHFRKCINEIAAYIVHLRESAIMFSCAVEELRERYNGVLDAIARAELKEAAATEYQLSLYQTGESAEYAQLHHIEPALESEESEFEIKEREPAASTQYQRLIPSSPRGADNSSESDSADENDTANIVSSFYPLAAGTEVSARRRRDLAARLQTVAQDAAPGTMSLRDIRTLDEVSAGGIDWDTIRVFRKCLGAACAKVRAGGDHKYTLEHISALLVLVNTVVFCVEPGNRYQPDHTIVVYQPWHSDTGDIHGWSGEVIVPDSNPRRSDCRLVPTTRLTSTDDPGTTAEIMDTHRVPTNDALDTPVYHAPVKSWATLVRGISEFIAMLEETVSASRGSDSNARPLRSHPTFGFVVAERDVPRYVCMLSTLKEAIQLFCNIPSESRWGLHIRVRV
jgi:hypothetical protein